MEFDRFHHFASLLIEDDFVLTYSGYVTEDILQAIGDTLRQQLLVKSHNRHQVKNLFSVFVELMQNVIRYGHEGPQPSHKSLPHAGQRFFNQITPINDDINNQPASRRLPQQKIDKLNGTSSI